MKNTKSKISIIWENFSTEITIFLIIAVTIACGIAGTVIQKYFFPETILKDEILLNFILQTMLFACFLALVISIIVLFIEIAIAIKKGVSYLFRKIKAVKNYYKMEFTEDAIRHLIVQGIVTDGYSYIEYLSKQLCIKEMDDEKRCSEWVLLRVDDISHMVTAYQKVFDEPVVLMDDDFKKMFSRLDEICDYSATAFGSSFVILYANAIMEMKKLAEYKEKYLKCSVFTVNVDNGITDKFTESYFTD